MSERRKKNTKPDTVCVPVRMSAELEGAIEAAAGRVKLSKQDTMRLAIERGLNVLIDQLTTQQPSHSAA